MSTLGQTKKVGVINAVESLGDLEVDFGITEKQISQLIHYSRTDQAVQTTSDPKRFKDHESINTWLQKGRSIYTMTNVDGDLLGIVWFGGKEMPEGTAIAQEYQDNCGVTFAIRIYGQARGKHLARPLTGITFKDYIQTDEFNAIPKKHFWLETHADNTPAVTAYEKFGFKHVTRPDDHGRILMVLENTEEAIQKST